MSNHCLQKTYFLSGQHFRGKLFFYLIVCILFLPVLCSCSSNQIQIHNKAPLSPNTIVMFFAGTPITASQIDAVKISIVENLIQKNSYLNNQLQDRKIEDRVLYYLFNQIEVNKQIIKYHASSYDKLTALIAPLQTFNENEAHQFYQSHTYLFSSSPPKLHVREIVVRDKKQASHLLDQLHARASFSELAQHYSIDPDQYKLQGGDLGWVTRGQMPSEWDNAVFSLSTNQISNIFQVSNLYFIVQVIEGPSYTPIPYQYLSPPYLRLNRNLFSRNSFYHGSVER